jgi:hypothetical protein
LCREKIFKRELRLAADEECNPPLMLLVWAVHNGEFRPPLRCVVMPSGNESVRGAHRRTSK